MCDTSLAMENIVSTNFDPLKSSPYQYAPPLLEQILPKLPNLYSTFWWKTRRYREVVFRISSANLQPLQRKVFAKYLKQIWKPQPSPTTFKMFSKRV